MFQHRLGRRRSGPSIPDGLKCTANALFLVVKVDQFFCSSNEQHLRNGAARARTRGDTEVTSRCGQEHSSYLELMLLLGKVQLELHLSLREALQIVTNDTSEKQSPDI